MIHQFKKLLSIPAFYHYIRQLLLLGMPLRTWAFYGNYNNQLERIADLGCGPADILRFIDRSKMPAFYLGIDISDRYLKSAKTKARKLNLDSKFITIDLNQLSDNKAIQTELIDTLNNHNITTVNLFGVIHHIDDHAVITALNTVFASETVQSLNTEDVLVIDQNHINNFYASLDRGDFVRKEDQYDELIKKSNWKKINKLWSQAGLQNVKYLHYKLSK